MGYCHTTHEHERHQRGLFQLFQGAPHPRGKRLVNSQKCFRAEDIEEVGDNRHTTFFEMLGNWSLGDYFKEEQLAWLFAFLTDAVGIHPNRLYVTVFSGDQKLRLPKDTESADIWKKLFAEKHIDAKDVEMGTYERAAKEGMQGGRIFYYDAQKNWWSRAGMPEDMPAGEPGGPDSEIFFDFGTAHDTAFGAMCHPNCDCGRFMEIGNSVFMEFIKTPEGIFGSLPERNVDFGGGLERIAAAANDHADIFALDIFAGIIKKLEQAAQKSYADLRYQKSFRVIADHTRAAVFMAGDGVEPSNTDQGYILRRLIRRAIRHAELLGLAGGILPQIVPLIIAIYRNTYTILGERETKIAEMISQEEHTFRETLARGLKQFEKCAANAGEPITALDAFILFTSYGFPIEMTAELAGERGIKVDIDGFAKEMEKHRARSRAGASQKFKGGLADHSEQSVKYHTATHLLHQALRDVLGKEAFQKGSNITPERLRFDFAFERKMTDEEKRKVEEIVNRQIREKLPVSYEDIPISEAEKRGAIGLFEEKYGDKVRIYNIGEYSIEFCGGPHVANTGALGHFKIAKEEAIAQGTRRIKAVLE